MPLNFLYSHNTPILLTNKIIVKKKTKQFFRNTKNQWANKYKKKKKVFGINKYSPFFFVGFFLQLV